MALASAGAAIPGRELRSSRVTEISCSETGCRSRTAGIGPICPQYLKDSAIRSRIGLSRGTDPAARRLRPQVWKRDLLSRFETGDGHADRKCRRVEYAERQHAAPRRDGPA